MFFSVLLTCWGCVEFTRLSTDEVSFSGVGPVAFSFRHLVRLGFSWSGTLGSSLWQQTTGLSWDELRKVWKVVWASSWVESECPRALSPRKKVVPTGTEGVRGGTARRSRSPGDSSDLTSLSPFQIHWSRHGSEPSTQPLNSHPSLGAGALSPSSWGLKSLVGAGGWKGPKLLKEVTQTCQGQRDRGKWPMPAAPTEVGGEGTAAPGGGGPWASARVLPASLGLKRQPCNQLHGDAASRFCGNAHAPAPQVVLSGEKGACSGSGAGHPASH